MLSNQAKPNEASNKTPDKVSNKMPDKTIKIYRRVLLFLCFFVGAGALFGGGLALIAPDGSLMGAQEIIPALQNSALQYLPLLGQHLDSLFLPATALLLFVFVPQTVAAALLLKKHPKQYVAGIVAGLLLETAMLVELVVIPNPLSVLYAIFGAAELFAGFICHFQRQKTNAL